MTRAKQANESSETDPKESKHGKDLYQNAGGGDRSYAIDFKGGRSFGESQAAIDDRGRPDFNLLQNFRAEAARTRYYVFDLLCWEGRDLTRFPLIERRALLKSAIVVKDERIRTCDYVEAAAKWPAFRGPRATA